MNKKFKTQIKYLNFRSKRYGYGYLHLSYNNEKEIILWGKDSHYIKCVGAGYVRNSCLNCKYRNINRTGDFTIGDFWNLQMNQDQWKKGVSLILVNNQKALNIFNVLRKDFIINEQNLNDAYKSQSCSLKDSKKIPPDYAKFFIDLCNYDWIYVDKKYLYPTSIKELIFDYLPPFFIASIRNLIKYLK